MSASVANGVTIRPESEADREAVARVHRAAFGRQDEAAIVERLHAEGDYLAELSLVAESAGEVVGHVALSRARVEDRPVLALGPIGVVPERQGQGIGIVLMHEALARAREAGEPLVVLLGHPEYYPRFGFVRASSLGLTLPIDVPDEAFMALELRPGGAAHGGRFRYSAAFGLPVH